MKELSDKSKPQRLEDLFRTQMEAAEATPSERVWERIEQGLDLKEAGYYKERVVWYRSLAAACVALLVCAAVYLYYDANTQHPANQQVATLPQTQNNPASANSKTSSPVASSPLNNNNSQPTENTNATAEAALPAQPALAAKEAGSKNNATNNYAINLPDNQVNANKNSAKTYAATQLNNNNVNQENIGLATGNLNNTKGENNLLTGANNISLARNAKRAVLIENREANNGLEPLQSVNAWALSKGATPADSLWKPKAIDATPPALAWQPTVTPEPEKPKMSRWSFSAKYAPQYFNQNVELASAAAPQYLMAPGNSSFNGAPAANVNTLSYTEALNEYDRNTSSGFSYNTAAAVGYALNEHWSLETGLLFTQNIATSKSSYVFSNSYLAVRYSNNDPMAGLNDTKNVAQAAALPTTALVASLAGQQHLGNAAVIQTPTYETEYRYRSLGMPLKLNYQTKSRKSFYFASVGLLTNLLVQANIVSESDRVPNMKFGSNTDSPFRSWQFATVLSAGKGFRVSESISLKAGLEGTQYLTSLAAHPENLNSKQRKPYTIGLALSSSYTLGK
ncbi:outer membrane beta-barrel protein [Adhaeribacter rhizoryzae]|uniref:Outer membrane beta-barrel protein n=1 Tax=Adhaeribacter rhizoryzae TaxID=2607907 RepID=A0A5M6D569_9BACT|nr:outer membrane beta-barrel protein [Adhaeribacter rhizoryzae]KAA5540355.1 outer membrane beta-barrel protein [Adhaeribacter rhizoryzae]